MPRVRTDRGGRVSFHLLASWQMASESCISLAQVGERRREYFWVMRILVLVET